MLTSQLLQGGQYIFDHDITLIRSHRRVIHHGCHSPLCECVGGKAIAVKRGASQGKEERPGRDATGIGRDGWMGLKEVV